MKSIKLFLVMNIFWFICLSQYAKAQQVSVKKCFSIRAGHKLSCKKNRDTILSYKEVYSTEGFITKRVFYSKNNIVFKYEIFQYDNKGKLNCIYTYNGKNNLLLDSLKNSAITSSDEEIRSDLVLVPETECGHKFVTCSFESNGLLHLKKVYKPNWKKYDKYKKRRKNLIYEELYEYDYFDGQGQVPD